MKINGKIKISEFHYDCIGYKKRKLMFFSKTHRRRVEFLFLTFDNAARSWTRLDYGNGTISARSVTRDLTCCFDQEIVSLA